MGDDDLTDIEVDGFKDLQLISGYKDQLYFTTFAHTPDTNGVSSKTDQFFKDYKTLRSSHNGHAYTADPNANVMLAYDAIRLVAKAYEHAWRGPDRPARSDVAHEIETTRGFDGAAGDVTIGANRVDPVDKLVTVLHVVQKPDESLQSCFVWDNKDGKADPKLQQAC